MSQATAVVNGSADRLPSGYGESAQVLRSRAGRARSGDVPLIALAVVHGAVLIAFPSMAVVAVGLWWNANTIAHNFIHHPFFGTRFANTLFSMYTSLLLGVPQTIWRERHLAHHAERDWRLRWSSSLACDACAPAVLWTALAIWQPHFLMTTYLPGIAIGLALAGIQGHFEHHTGTVSHYGRLYNAITFNDGYHVEHHAQPGLRWWELPGRVAPEARASRWPPLLRILDSVSLEGLERAVIRSTRLQRVVLRLHRNAFAGLLREVPSFARIGVVGGGLFPRTVLVLQDLLPAAQITVIDADAGNLAIARQFPGVGAAVRFVHERFTAATDTRDFDVLVLPLSFQGDRMAVYRKPPAAAVIVHDWLWRRRGTSRIVSICLVKRLNLVRR